MNINILLQAPLTVGPDIFIRWLEDASCTTDGGDKLYREALIRCLYGLHYTKNDADEYNGTDQNMPLGCCGMGEGYGDFLGTGNGFGYGRAHESVQYGFGNGDGSGRCQITPMMLMMVPGRSKVKPGRWWAHDGDGFGNGWGYLSMESEGDGRGGGW